MSVSAPCSSMRASHSLTLGRQLVLLPAVRADGVAEQRLVVAAFDPVGAAVLLVGPADREV